MAREQSCAGNTDAPVEFRRVGNPVAGSAIETPLPLRLEKEIMLHAAIPRIAGGFNCCTDSGAGVCGYALRRVFFNRSGDHPQM